VTAVLAFVIAYLVGSVEFGVIVPRALGIDIYDQGSGNPGTSNVFRSLGKGPASLVLLGDAAKGALAAGIGALWVGEAAGFACAFAAVLEHLFPVWFRFKGGRGVATAIGAAIWLEPWFGLALAVLWVAIVLIGKVASVASLVAMALYAPGFYVTGHRGPSLLWALGIVVLVVAKHAPNIGRIAGGRESRMTTS